MLADAQDNCIWAGPNLIVRVKVAGDKALSQQ